MGAYFMDELGLPYGGNADAVGAAGIPEKIAFLDEFFADLA
jgi:hypothetical protein